MQQGRTLPPLRQHPSLGSFSSKEHKSLIVMDMMVKLCLTAGASCSGAYCSKTVHRNTTFPNQRSSQDVRTLCHEALPRGWYEDVAKHLWCIPGVELDRDAGLKCQGTVDPSSWNRHECCCTQLWPWQCKQSSSHFQCSRCSRCSSESCKKLKFAEGLAA